MEMCFPTVAGMIRNRSIRKICPSDSRARRRPPPGVCPAAGRAAPAWPPGTCPGLPPTRRWGRPVLPFPHLLAGLRSPSGESRRGHPTHPGAWGGDKTGDLGLSPGGEQRDGEGEGHVCANFAFISWSGSGEAAAGSLPLPFD